MKARAARRRARLGVAAGVLVVACGSCDGGLGAGAELRSVRVFAAASLTGAFESLAAEFERRTPGTRVELHFAGTPQLVVQLREGAAADVFASADEVNMQRVVANGGTAGSPVVFASNHLAIVVPRGNPRGVQSLADLGRDELRVVLCGPEVPAGRYAREALAKAGVTVRSRSDEPSVSAVLGKVAMGEVDAGVVFATDVARGGSGLEAVPIAAEHDVVGRCVITAMATGRARDAGAAFVAFVGSADGRAMLVDLGFGPP